MGSVTVTFKPICFHCGGTSGSELLNDDFTRDWKESMHKWDQFVECAEPQVKNPPPGG